MERAQLFLEVDLHHLESRRVLEIPCHIIHVVGIQLSIKQEQPIPMKAIVEKVGRATESEKMAKLAGGTQQLTHQMVEALDQKAYQWALELSDTVKWLTDGDRELARKVKIRALSGLGAQEYNAPNRNDYLSYANELESKQLSELWS